MTPEMMIKKQILDDANQDDIINFCEKITEENVEDLYAHMLVDSDLNWDLEAEFREGDFESNIESEYSRHYESKSVAKKLSDGTWLGWTYWFGGGKHGSPEEIDWMNEAYLLDVTEEEKVLTVRNFTKKKVA